MPLWKNPPTRVADDGVTEIATRRINATDLQDVVDAFSIGTVTVRRGQSDRQGKILTDFHNLSDSDLAEVIVYGEVHGQIYMSLTLGKKAPAFLLNRLLGTGVSVKPGESGIDHAAAEFDAVEAEIIRVLKNRGHREPSTREAFTLAGVGACVVAVILLVWTLTIALAFHSRGTSTSVVVQSMVIVAIFLTALAVTAVALTRILRDRAATKDYGSVRISHRTRSGVRDLFEKAALVVAGAVIGAVLASIFRSLFG